MQRAIARTAPTASRSAEAGALTNAGFRAWCAELRAELGRPLTVGETCRARNIRSLGLAPPALAALIRAGRAR